MADMIPIHQTRPHNPAIGQKGNCFQATLASILHLNIEDIPELSDDSWVKEINEFLRPYGLAYILITLNTEMKDLGIQGCYHEVSVPSETNLGGHSCVAVDGEVVFDPMTNPYGNYAVDTVGFFVVLKPWKYIESIDRRTNHGS